MAQVQAVKTVHRGWLDCLPPTRVDEGTVAVREVSHVLPIGDVQQQLPGDDLGVAPRVVLGRRSVCTAGECGEVPDPVECHREQRVGIGPAQVPSAAEEQALFSGSPAVQLTQYEPDGGGREQAVRVGQPDPVRQRSPGQRD